MTRDPHRAVDVNREYYGQASPGRDDYWRKMAAPRFRVRVLLEALERLAPSSVVDLGCGNGVLLEEIRARHPAARFAGVDLSPEQIEENRRLRPWGSWQVANLDGVADLGRLSGSFDVVIASEVIEHLDTPEQLLSNARALSREGGRLLLSTQSGTVHTTEKRVGHRRHFLAAEMRELLERNGWLCEQVWNAGFPFHDLSKWYANLNPEASIAQFGSKPYGWRENLTCQALRLAFRFNSRSRGAQLFALARLPGATAGG